MCILVFRNLRIHDCTCMCMISEMLVAAGACVCVWAMQRMVGEHLLHWEWLKGRGLPVTCKTLVKALRNTKLNTFAYKI